MVSAEVTMINSDSSANTEKSTMNRVDIQKFVFSRKLRVCFVMNIAPLYRKAVLELLDKDNDIDFFFYSGDISVDIDALYDMRNLSGFRGYLRNRYNGNKLVWQKGWWKPLFGKYNVFILTGNPGIRSNWFLTFFARLMGKKVYLWSHGLYGNESSVTLKKNMGYMRFSGNLFLYGNYARKKLLAKKFPQERISVVYNSLDYDRQKLLRDKYVNAGFMRNYFGNDFPVAAFIGRLTPQKSLHLLIEAVGILKLEGVDVNIIFVGSGDETERQLQELAVKVGVDDRVWFYGECYDEEMIACILQNSALCVSPGNVGLTAIHALTYGIPVITHNLFREQMPEFEAVRPGYTGDFFKYNDSLSLAEHIERWLKIMGDKEKREKVKKSCYRLIDGVYNPHNQLAVMKRRLISDNFPVKR